MTTVFSSVYERKISVAIRYPPLRLGLPKTKHRDDIVKRTDDKWQVFFGKSRTENRVATVDTLVTAPNESVRHSNRCSAGTTSVEKYEKLSHRKHDSSEATAVFCLSCQQVTRLDLKPRARSTLIDRDKSTSRMRYPGPLSSLRAKCTLMTWWPLRVVLCLNARPFRSALCGDVEVYLCLMLFS